MAPLPTTPFVKLTIKALDALAKSWQVQVPQTTGNKKSTVIAHLLEFGPAPLREYIQGCLDFERERAADRHRGTKRKRGEADDESGGPRSGDIHPTRPEAELPDYDADRHDVRQYLDLPTVSEVKECYGEYYKATSNEALCTEVCAVCARNLRYKEEQMQQIDYESIPNVNRLAPVTPHPAHDLYRGSLMAPQGVVVDPSTGNMRVHICSGCLEDLKSNKAGPPKHSLANGLWIGAVPEEISCLSFVEQLLLSHYYHRCYVFKLYPTMGGAGMDPSTLQRAMKGNVTTYEQDMQGSFFPPSFDIGEASQRC